MAEESPSPLPRRDRATASFNSAAALGRGITRELFSLNEYDPASIRPQRLAAESLLLAATPAYLPFSFNSAAALGRGITEDANIYLGTLQDGFNSAAALVRGITLFVGDVFGSVDMLQFGRSAWPRNHRGFASTILLTWCRFNSAAALGRGITPETRQEPR